MLALPIAKRAAIHASVIVVSRRNRLAIATCSEGAFRYARKLLHR